MVNAPLNLFTYLMLMGFFASIGMKIATVGTYLVRPIVVKLREEKEKNQKSKTSNNFKKNGKLIFNHLEKILIL